MRTLLLPGLMGLAGAGLCAEMPPNATELGCTNCHAMEGKLVGPSWMDISRRYHAKRNDPAVLDHLVKNVSNGSQDNWGGLPMVASDPAGKKQNQIVEVVKYILALSGEAPESTGK